MIPYGDPVYTQQSDSPIEFSMTNKSCKILALNVILVIIDFFGSDIKTSSQFAGLIFIKVYLDATVLLYYSQRLL